MKKWVKVVGLLAVAVLSISVAAGIALAQGPVDEDGDGICDVCGRELGTGAARGWRFSQDGEYPCEDFVDENGDGICDLCGEQTGGPRLGQDGEQGARRGPFWDERQAGEEFVDDDGDGVCDNYDGLTPRGLGHRGRGGAGSAMGYRAQRVQ